MVESQNKYIFITTEGETLAPNPNQEIENCQVLGIVDSDNKAEAINKLLSENQWLQNSGFDISQSRCLQILTESIRSDILAIIDYLSEYELNAHGVQQSKNMSGSIIKILNRLSKI